MKFLLFMLSCACAFGQGASCIGVRNVATLQAMNPVLYPTQVAGLTLWLCSDVAAYRDNLGHDCADGDTCQVWGDQSGLGHDAIQNTAGNRPVFHANVINGKPGLDFGTATLRSMLSDLGGSVAIPNAAFVVFYPSNLISAGFLIDGGTAVTRNMLFQQGDTMRMSGALTIIYGHQTLAWEQISVQFNGAKGWGEHVARNRIYGTTDTQSPAKLRIGSSYVPDQNFNGMIAEVIFFNGLLSTTQAYGIEMYLKRKYALPDPF